MTCDKKNPAPYCRGCMSLPLTGPFHVLTTVFTRGFPSVVYFRTQSRMVIFPLCLMFIVVHPSVSLHSPWHGLELAHDKHVASIQCLQGQGKAVCGTPTISSMSPGPVRPLPCSMRVVLLLVHGRHDPHVRVCRREALAGQARR